MDTFENAFAAFKARVANSMSHLTEIQSQIEEKVDAKSDDLYKKV